MRCLLVQCTIISTRWGKPTRASPLYSEVFLVSSLKQFICWSKWRWPFLILSRTISERFLFLHFAPPGDRGCDVFGFVPARSVSSSSTLYIFQDEATCNGCFARQFTCSVISFDSGMARTVHSQEALKIHVEHCHTGFPCYFSLCVASSFNPLG